MKSMLRTAKTIAAKDLRIELRSRVIANQVIPFAALVMILFAFALDSDAVLERVAPGLVWLATIFSVLFIVARSFALETTDGALEALRAAGVDPMGIFLGKTLALATQLIALEAVLVGASVVLYRADVSASGGVLLVTTAILATVGLASVGTLYGGLAAGAKGRETLLPLLLLPVVAPVLIGATRATESAFGTNGIDVSEGWPWLGLLAVFAVLFSVVGAVAFGPLVDD
ncbi:MAG: heme exporter protein CcmB [Actinobacteria bacterium]|nr:heme exporter protein CcmB [Actinomycetota bacterium]